MYCQKMLYNTMGIRGPIPTRRLKKERKGDMENMQFLVAEPCLAAAIKDKWSAARSKQTLLPVEERSRCECQGVCQRQATERSPLKNKFWLTLACCLIELSVTSAYDLSNPFAHFALSVLRIELPRGAELAGRVIHDQLHPSMSPALRFASADHGASEPLRLPHETPPPACLDEDSLLVVTRFASSPPLSVVRYRTANTCYDRN